MQYSTESTDAPFISGLLFPPSQLPDAPSPESFDQEFAELELCLPFDSEQSDGLFTTFRDFRPIISTPSVSTSTICVYGATPSTYSPDITRSGYFIPSELDEGYLSLNNGPYGTHDSIHSAVFSNGPPSIPPPHPAQAQFEFGTSDLSPNLIGISPEYLSAGIQSSPALSVHVTPDLEAQPLPIPNRPFKCPHSPHCKAETILGV